MLTLKSSPKIKTAIASTTVDNETVVVNPAKGKVNVLNSVGTFIWGQIDGQQTVNEIVNQVCAEFETERDTAESDTLEFIQDLIARNIIEISG